MAIKMNDEFKKKFEKRKNEELVKIDRVGRYEVGTFFEDYILGALSFSNEVETWSDAYWIFFPNPEKVEWEDVYKALKTGFNYLSETEKMQSVNLGQMD
ncbi:MAG: hypothetical protein M1536_07655 [Firmicutes bacterium]|nr:hypothetical protein [Bacillota bacterium]